MFPLTVGFDLDMTLVDTRPGIHATYTALSARTGVHVDADLAVSRLGPPLQDELAHWFPAGRVEETAALYRELYPSHAVAPSPALPGAREAIAAVQAADGRVIVVTAKNTPQAELHMEHLGLGPDAVIGGLWAEAKADALREHGASVYVGDHLGDVRGAKRAGALSVGVPTGPIPAERSTPAAATAKPAPISMQTK